MVREKNKDLNSHENEKVLSKPAKRAFIQELEEELKKRKMSKSDLAKIMNTSRASVNRILDPNKPSNIKSLISAANAVGKNIEISIVDGGE